jgi:hypothetical protein
MDLIVCVPADCTIAWGIGNPGCVNCSFGKWKRFRCGIDLIDCYKVRFKLPSTLHPLT